MQIGDHFRHFDLADQQALERIDPDTARCRYPDIAIGIGLHAVRDTRLDCVLNAGRKDSSVSEPAILADVEHADVCLFGVVHPHPAFTGRKAKPVRLGEHVAVRHKDCLVTRPVTGRQHVDTLKALLKRTGNTKMFHAAIGRIGEKDCAIRPYDDVVRRIQFPAFEMRRKQFPVAVRAEPRDRARGMLTDEEVQLRVIGHAVALVRRAQIFAHTLLPGPLAPDIARHVGEQEMAFHRMPDGPLGENETGADPFNSGVLVHQVQEFRVDNGMSHRSLPVFPS